MSIFNGLIWDDLGVPPFEATSVYADEDKVFITQAAHSVALDVVATVGFCTPRKKNLQGNTLRSGSSLAFHPSGQVGIRLCTTPQTKLAATFFVEKQTLPEMSEMISAAKLFKSAEPSANSSR